MKKRAEIAPFDLPLDVDSDHADDITDRAGTLVAAVYGACGHSDERAAYIVRACNNFPMLVEVLRMLREITGEDWKDSFIGNEPRGKLGVYLTYAQLESIHSAIAAAEGE